ncbi:MAG TPA: hypothetical protein VGR66_10265 [Candidatus Eisenbacteria bacterium]|jgi:hypothetical protein|nr:hypothetical protein [Candidatus Eisenbacteria bacterium]
MTLREEDEALLVKVAERVARLHMEMPAVLFLETVRPLSFVGSQAMVFFQPFAQAIFPWTQYERFTELMADRENLERLTRLIEAEADAREAREKEARRARREKES